MKKRNKVYQDILALLSANHAAQLTDEQLALAMRERQPKKKPYTAKHVIGWRSIYNRGLIQGQESKPKERLRKYKPRKVKIRKRA